MATAEYKHVDTGEHMSTRGSGYDNADANEKTIDITDKRYKVRPDKARFPLCIVWTPLPCLTQIIPCIGHTGIGDSRGITHDFAGPYYISIDDLAFGETHKYVIL